MKLLLVSSSFKGGGITSYAIELAASYAECFQMSVIIGDDSLCPLDQFNVKVYHYDMGDTSIINANNVLNLINLEIGPDIIINSCARLMPLLVPFLNNDIKVINISHSLRYNEADYAGLNSEYADAVVALSDFNKQYLNKTFSCKDKVNVVFNFVRELKEQSLLLKKKIKPKTTIIVFSGGGTAAKAPEIIYRVVTALLKTDLDFKFYWLGNTTPPFKKIQPFKEIKDILPIDTRLIITGRVSREEALQITNEANIFLIPSRREGCPMALLEAMRVGTIAITSDYNNACKEIIRNGYNGYVIPHNDTNGFVNRIIDIIKKPDQYTDIYTNAYETYKEKLSFEVWKGKMDVLISNKESTHVRRRLSFNSKLFLFYRRKQNKMMKYNMLHSFFFELLPSAIPFICFYIKFKIRKSHGQNARTYN